MFFVIAHPRHHAAERATTSPARNATRVILQHPFVGHAAVQIRPGASGVEGREAAREQARDKSLKTSTVPALASAALPALITRNFAPSPTTVRKPLSKHKWHRSARSRATPRRNDHFRLGGRHVEQPRQLARVRGQNKIGRQRIGFELRAGRQRVASRTVDKFAARARSITPRPCADPEAGPTATAVARAQRANRRPRAPSSSRVNCATPRWRGRSGPSDVAGAGAKRRFGAQHAGAPVPSLRGHDQRVAEMSLLAPTARSGKRKSRAVKSSCVVAIFSKSSRGNPGCSTRIFPQCAGPALVKNPGLAKAEGQRLVRAKRPGRWRVAASKPEGISRAIRPRAPRIHAFDQGPGRRRRVARGTRRRRAHRQSPARVQFGRSGTTPSGVTARAAWRTIRIYRR